MSKETVKKLKILSILVCVIVLGVLTVFLGKPILRFFSSPEEFRLYVEEKGWVARIVFVLLMAFQVVAALIPGEPLEIAAGAAFGSIEGTVLVLAGIALGSTVVYFLVKQIGVRMVEVFFPMEKIHSLSFLQNKRKLELILFLLMFVPGTPKDLITYFVGLTPLKAKHWLILCTFARFPSVITSTVGGDALGKENYLFALGVFLVSSVISLGGVWLHHKLVSQHKDQ